MSTIKISQLPILSALNANTNNTIFLGVDVPSGKTGQLTATTLAQGLYSNNTLIVGNYSSLLPNTIAEFSLSGNSYIQTNLVNTNNGGSADIVITASSDSGGTDSTYFIDMGFVNKYYQPGQEFNNIGTAVYPLDGYLYVQGSNGSPGGNLILGTTTTNTSIKFIVGGGSNSNVVATMTSNNLVLNTSTSLVFGDGTIQNTAAVSNNYIQASYKQANLANSIANTAVQNTAVIQLQTISLSGNLIANTPGQGIFVDRFTSNNATFNQNLVVLGNLTSNTLLGNIFFSNVTTITTQSNSILWTTQAGAIAQQTAQLWYYSNTQSLILDTDIPGDRLSISKVLFFRAFNSTGATIPANSFVRLVTGVTGNQIPYIALADATNSANATVAGFVRNAIANSAYGFVYSQGIVEDLNTTGLGANGDILFLSTTPGIASNVAPISGNSNTVVQLGRVILRDSSLGKLFIQNQLRQAYGRTNGSLLYAYANNITASNTVSINDFTQTLTSNNIVANTLTVSGNTVVTQNTNIWTPNVTFSTTGASYQTQVGTYIKVGKMVFATFNIVSTTAGTGNASLNISSLFATANTVANSVVGSLLVSQVGGTVSSTVLSPQGSISAGAQTVPIFTTIVTSGGGGSTTYRQLTGADLGATFQLSGTIQYISAN